MCSSESNMIFHVVFQIIRTYAIWDQSWIVAGSLTLLALPSFILIFVSNCGQKLCLYIGF